MADSVSFDRIAERYDETRGGMERGHAVAAAMALQLTDGTTLEIGVGTGLIAAGLTERNRPVVGIDLSIAMLERAVPRIGNRVGAGDATVLPIRSGSVDNVVSSWVLHLVGDRGAAVAECARVLRLGGRFVVVDARPVWGSDDILSIQRRTFGLARQFDVQELLSHPGFAPVAVIDGEQRVVHESPHEVALHIERRDWSSLWDVDAETWSTIVEPVIRELRALPDPDRPRERSSSHPVHVYERVAVP